MNLNNEHIKKDGDIIILVGSEIIILFYIFIFFFVYGGGTEDQIFLFVFYFYFLHLANTHKKNICVNIFNIRERRKKEVENLSKER